MRAILAGAVLITTAATANAAAISVFNDGSFVDTSREGPNLIADITGLGHSVSTFTGVSGAAWSTGIGGNSILVLPEMERGNLQSSLSGAAATVIQNFVNSGGLLVQANAYPANADLPSSLFGWSLTQTGSIGSTNLIAGNAAGTPYAGGPDPLPGSNAVEGILTSSLPGSALSIYDDGSNTSVFFSPVGAGNYAYLGFDWFEEPTPSAWLSVLDRTLSLQGGQRIPEPAGLALFGIGLIGLGVARRRKTA